MKEKKAIQRAIFSIGFLLIMVTFVLQPDIVKAASPYTCTVVYISNGGNSVPTQSVSQGTYLTSLPTPTREGYTFAGWYTNDTLTTLISSSYYISVMNTDSTLILFAKWTKISVTSITATYPTTTATIDSTLDRSKITVTAIYSNGTVAKVTDFTITNLKVSTLYSNTFIVTYENCTAYFNVVGIAKQYYTVTFVPNGGSNVDTITGVLTGDTIILPKTTRSGYTFKGWYQDSSLTLEFTATTPVTYNMYIYAKWEKDKVGDDPVEYTLDHSTISLNLYEEDNVIVGSYNKDDQNYITYESSKPSVVKVDKTGRVTGLKYGTATIYVVAPDDSLLKCKVTVSTKHPATKIKTNVTGKTLKVGDTFTIKTTISPSNVSVSKLKYTSSKKSIASVSSSGKVIAKKAGTCYITVRTTDGTGLMKTVKIVVK